jgi:hypothetical protein
MQEAVAPHFGQQWGAMMKTHKEFFQCEAQRLVRELQGKFQAKRAGDMRQDEEV